MANQNIAHGISGKHCEFKLRQRSTNKMKKEIGNNYRKESFCAKCSLQFDKPSLLELHESIVHVKKKSPASVANSEVKLKKTLFECQNCRKNFTTKGSLDRRRHRRKVI